MTTADGFTKSKVGERQDEEHHIDHVRGVIRDAVVKGREVSWEGVGKAIFSDDVLREGDGRVAQRHGVLVRIRTVGRWRGSILPRGRALSMAFCRYPTEHLLAGPMVHYFLENCWVCYWYRVHQYRAEKQDNIDGITPEVRPLPHQLHVFAAH